MPNATVEFYRKNSQSFTESTLNVDMSPLYQRFLPNIPAGGHILDAGCGSGRDALHFKKVGFTVSAFDACPELAAFASDLLGEKVEVKTFAELSENQQYDGIWCCASLLHVKQGELPSALQNLATALKSGGSIYVSFKYGDAERNAQGRHFTDLNEDGLAELVAKQQLLEVFEVWQTCDQRPGREHELWLNALLKRR